MSRYDLPEPVCDTCGWPVQPVADFRRRFWIHVVRSDDVTCPDYGRPTVNGSRNVPADYVRPKS